MDSEMNEIPFFDLGWLIKRYGGFTRDDLKANERAKERTTLKEDGYSDEDIDKILLGANKKDFKPEGGSTDIEEDPLADL
jgi:hypothetical protein